MKALESLVKANVRQHPDSVARLVEKAEADEISAFMAELSDDLAAMVMSRMAPLSAARGLAVMEPKAAARIVAELEPAGAASLLRRLEPPERRAVLAALSKGRAESIERMLRYRPDQAAGRIDPHVLSISSHARVAEALALQRQAAHGALNYVYAVDDAQRLIGVVSVRELLLADPEGTVGDVMVPDPYRLLATEPLAAVVSHPGWQRAHAMPVVDAGGRFLGVIRYSQFRAIQLELGRAESGPSAERTGIALAELFWLGASALAHLGQTAFSVHLSDISEERP